jgi:hypothetical protein
MSGSEALPPLKEGFRKVALRLQSIARMNEGVGVVTISVIIKDGNAMFWTNPKITMMEPKTAQEDLIRILTGDV